jgi:hypothetical protein
MRFKRFLETYQDRIAIWIGLILVLVLGVLFSSCSCNYHLAKARAKCPTAFSSDTITVRDTLKTIEAKVDTVFQSKQGDTVYIDRDHIKIKYVKKGGDTVFIDGKCPPQYIPYIKKVYITKTVYEFDGWLWVRKNIWTIFWILIALVVIRQAIQYFRLTR